jgi:hypothetical protein
MLVAYRLAGLSKLETYYGGVRLATQLERCSGSSGGIACMVDIGSACIDDLLGPGGMGRVAGFPFSIVPDGNNDPAQGPRRSL